MTRIQGTAARPQPRRRWPFIVGAAAVVLVGVGVTLAIVMQPVRIDDDITQRNAKEIARLMEAQVDTELAILGR